MTTIRPASEGDIALIRRLAAEVFPATYGAILTPAQLDYMMEWMYSAAQLRREMEEGLAWFVAQYDGEPCGYLCVQREADNLYHLQKIYVLPAFQGRGIGEELFRHAVGYVRRMYAGPCRMELNVNRQNKALGFYERMGMRRLREGDFDIGNGYYMNDYIMGIDLK